jgi:hypothetical protein
LGKANKKISLWRPKNTTHGSWPQGRKKRLANHPPGRALKEAVNWQVLTDIPSYIYAHAWYQHWYGRRQRVLLQGGQKIPSAPFFMSAFGPICLFLTRTLMLPRHTLGPCYACFGVCNRPHVSIRGQKCA